MLVVAAGAGGRERSESRSNDEGACPHSAVVDNRETLPRRMHP
jgi:hypothetical protein